jgi:DNA-binding transcriptional LysR family regulator
VAADNKGDSELSSAGPMMRLSDTNMDVRLLRVLHTLLNECSVSRTAELLGQSPPAVSLALRRLRQTIGDPILVRSGARLVPTERGLALRAPVARALESLDQIVNDEASFEPARAEREINVASATSLAAFVLPPFIERVRADAPNVSLVVRTIEPEYDYVRALEEGELDMVIGDWPSPPEHLRRAPLLQDEIACMMRTDHPYAAGDPMSLEDYLKLDHLAPTPSSRTYLGPVGAPLAQLGVKRRIVMTVPEYNLVPYVLLRTDLVFTTARLFAEHWSSFFPIRVVRAPTVLPPLGFYLLCHERSHHAGHSRWARALLREICQGFSAKASRGRSWRDYALSEAIKTH